jgi:hypothetical protein
MTGYLILKMEATGFVVNTDTSVYQKNGILKLLTLTHSVVCVIILCGLVGGYELCREVHCLHISGFKAT